MSGRHLVRRVCIIKCDTQATKVFYMSERHIAQSVNDKIRPL